MAFFLVQYLSVCFFGDDNTVSCRRRRSFHVFLASIRKEPLEDKRMTTKTRDEYYLDIQAMHSAYMGPSRA